MAKPTSRFDDKLRDIPQDAHHVQSSINDLQVQLHSCADLRRQVGLLGEIGVYQRQLGELDAAETSLRHALAIVAKHRLGMQLEIQQKIRLGHVLQWQRKFAESDRLFDETINICRSDPQLTMYLDFALQHAGKNLFDQARFAEALALFGEALRLRVQRQAPPDQIKSTELAIERTRERVQRSIYLNPVGPRQ